MLGSENTRTFTLNEARALIPRLRKLLTRAIFERARLTGMRGEIDKARQNAHRDGGTSMGPAYLKHLYAFSEAVGQIELLGVLVKDLRTGLVDFPYEHNGRIVFLCWKPDEDKLEWWHEVDTGFSGRYPVGDDFE
jgi:hypothetical protein